MRSPKTLPHRTALLTLLLAALLCLPYADALSQSYCSSENTGSGYDVDYDIYQSNGACHDTCVDNYAFAIVQYQNCWCSNYAPADTVDVSECNTDCPGYPDEQCGNSDQDLFGYIKLDRAASGTAGGSSSAASSTTSTTASSTTEESSSSSVSPSSSTTPETSSTYRQRPASTVYNTVSVVATVDASPSVIVSVSVVTPTTSTTPTTTSTTSTTSSTPTSTTTTSTSTTPTSTSTTAAPTTSSVSSTTATPVVSTRVVTLSGEIVTQTVTSTPTSGSSSSSAADQLSQTSKHKSTPAGTIAAAVIGSIVGLALLVVGALFLYRRRRNNNSGDPESPRRSPGRMARNASVLSKAGLLSSTRATDNEKHFDGHNDSTRQSTLLGTDTATDSPVSPVGGPFEVQRRNSRPMVYDQRLNPAAIMQNWQANSSRNSVGTMQDQRDYSRPLGVTNPDPEPHDY